MQKEELKQSKLICDGAFGTYFSALGYHGLPERANLDAKEVVKRIHSEYISAGARLIRTNTFAANTKALNTDFVTIATVLREALEIARSAAAECEEQVLIAADIGALEETLGYQEEEAFEEYQSIVNTFLNAGAELLLFETMSEFGRLPELFEQIKSKYPETIIMVQFAINQHGYTEKGIGYRKLLMEASTIPNLDVVGFNCGVGPGHLFRLLSEVEFPSNLVLSALPNAGYPNTSSGRIVFLENKEYFATKLAEIAKLGVHLLGGCCGTDPEYIRLMSQKLSELEETDQKTLHRVKEEKPKTKIDNRFFKQHENKKIIAVELSPPFNANPESMMDAANQLRKCNVDVVTFPDSPSGRTRADSILMSIKVLRETGLCVMPHVCCRDKNAIAIRSQILGAHINGVKNFLVITGDPVPVSARGDIKSVFNFDSIGMMKIMQQMNQEEFSQDMLVFGGAINHTRPNLEVEIARISKKMDNGASFFMSQPVFGEEDIEHLRRIKIETNALILCGVMPLVSRKNAIFMKNEMTGIRVPDELINRYPIDASKEVGEEVGITLAKEVIEKTKDFVDGYYFSIPFNRTYLLDKMVARIK